MRRKLTILLTLLAAATIVLPGCGALRRLQYQSTLEIEPPPEHEIISTTYMALPQEDAWDTLLDRIVSSRFDIVEMDYDGKVITLAATADTPGLYVDCGRCRTEATGPGVFKVVSDNRIVGDYTYRASCVGTRPLITRVTGWDGTKTTSPAPLFKDVGIGCFARESGLQATMRVRVVPDGEGTSISAEAEFVLTSVETRIYESGRPYPSAGESTSSTVRVEVTTASPGTSDWGVPGHGDFVLCRSTGRLEAEALSLLK